MPSPLRSTSDLLLPSDAFVCAQEAEDEVFGVLRMRLAVFLLLRPAGTGNEEEVGVRTDRLLIGFRRFDAGDLRALVCVAERDWQHFERRRFRPAPWYGAWQPLSSKQQPRTLRAL